MHALLNQSRLFFSQPELHLLVTEEVPRIVEHILGAQPLQKPESRPECPRVKRRMLRAAIRRPEINRWLT